MQQTVITMNVGQTDAERFNGKMGLVVPVTRQDIIRMREVMIKLHDFLKFNVRCLRTLHQIAEDDEAANERILKTLHMLAEPADAAEMLHDELRVMLGKAILISPCNIGPDTGETIQ